MPDLPVISWDWNRPVYANPGDAGMDLISSEDILLEPGKVSLVKTGVKIALPDNTVGMVVPRSGLAAKHGVTVVNSPGIIDSGYRGEIKVIMTVLKDEKVYLPAGSRVAQLVVVPFEHCTLQPVESFEGETVRGSDGFGSSGV